MGLSSKHVSGDHRDDIIQGFDWGGQITTVQQSSSRTPELSKPPPIRRHQPPQQSSEPPLKCPRCASTNTKFCYYNNYNKSQPRHFCKSCKRHWTKGGTLRTVPVGGGRKNKRPKISNPSTAAAATPAGAVRQEDHKPNNFPSRILHQSLINNPTSPPPLLQETRDSCVNINNGINGRADSTTISTGLNINNNQNAEFHEFTSLSSFDMMNNASVGPTPYNDHHHSLNLFDHNYTAGNILEYSMEESTITTVINYIPTSSGSGPSLWPGPNTTSSLEMPSYSWNWNEIDDVLTSSDHLNISWPDDDYDKAEIKP
ncbi:hypothetical protein ACP275_13G156400 [Erythranthe tilingii]